jgi:tRNA1Val (adenine37-N6)-methyltransferase
MFHFKQFSISDKASAMKIGTDSVLLGSWVDVEQAWTILDIGTGSGLLALMMAQRTNAIIDAVEIDQCATAEALDNVSKSAWKDRISIQEKSFQQYSHEQPGKYDLIISNPPFFRKSLKPGEFARTISRHDEMLPLRDLLTGTISLLADSGKAAFVFPAQSSEEWLQEALLLSLYPQRICYVYPREGNPCKRWMIEFSKSNEVKTVYTDLYIRDRQANYTQQYKEMTADFYLGL